MGIGQKRVGPFNDIVLLVFERPLVTRGPKYLIASKSSEFNINVSPDIMFTFCINKIVFTTSDRATLGFYCLLAVLGSICDKFG